jgi:predicted CoA-binding protein
MNSEQALKEILLSAKTIATVGLSSNPEKDSYSVAQYLKNQGYRVIPVNPTATEILGETSYPDLESVPEKSMWSRSFANLKMFPVAEARSRLGQSSMDAEGIVNEKLKARAAGLHVVMDACVLETHKRLIGTKPRCLAGFPAFRLPFDRQLQGS